MNAWPRQSYLTLTLVLYACTGDMASGNPVDDWVSQDNHSVADSVGQYADDVWDTEENFEAFDGNETEDDLGGLAGNHSETNTTNRTEAEHWNGPKQQEELETSQTIYSDENLHFQKKNGDINLNNSNDSRGEERRRSLENVSTEGTTSYVSTTTSYVTRNNVNTTTAYDHTFENTAAVQNTSQQTRVPSIHDQAVTQIPQNEIHLESIGRDSEGTEGNEDIESESRPSLESNDGPAGLFAQTDHETFPGEQNMDTSFSLSNSSSDRIDIFDGNPDGIHDGGSERRDHIDNGNGIDHHALQERGNVTPVPTLLTTQPEQNGYNNVTVTLSTERTTLAENVSVAAQQERSQLTPATPSKNIVETITRDNISFPESVDLPEYSLEPFSLTTESNPPLIVHSNETIQLIPPDSTSITYSITPGTTTSSPSVSPESTQTHEKELSTPSELPDITETTSDEHIVKPTSTPEIPTQQWEPASEDTTTTTTATRTTQPTLIPPTLPLEPEFSTPTIDPALFTTRDISRATEAWLETPTETSGEVTPDVKLWNITTSIPAEVSMELPLETVPPQTSESFPEDVHEKFSPTTEQTTDYFDHPSFTAANSTTEKVTPTTIDTGLVFAVVPVPTGEPAVGSVNCSDDKDGLEQPSAIDKIKTTHMPSTYLVLELAISWSVFCSSQDRIKSEIYGIMRNGTVSLNIEQIHVYNPGKCHCADTAQLIHVSIYLLNKTLVYDQELTLLCGNTLKKFQGHSDSFLILNKLKGVIINGDPIKPVPVQIDDSSLLSDPGVTVAIVLAVVGGCCCIALISLQVIVRRRNKDHLSLKPNMKRSVSWSSDSIRLSAINKSRPNSGLYNPGLDLTDLQLEPSRPLNYAQLSNYCCNQMKIEDEFQTLPYRMPRLSVVPSGEEDRNRYANVLPLTHTRVKLLQDGPEPRGTYINANYVSGPNNQCQYYIATQAPITNTVADFWTMVWQQNSKAIVMLTQLEEDGQSKCLLYWPELVGKCAALKWGDFLIELKQKDVHQEYIASKLEVHHLRKIEKREVYHFWYTCWPSQGLPEPISLVKLVLDIRPKYEDGTAPLVVHCSPGTGRTGTFIALDLCMRQFETMRLVDILKTVYLIRQERAGAVQSKEQYYLLYNAISEYATIVVSPVVSTASSATTLHALLSS